MPNVKKKPTNVYYDLQDLYESYSPALSIFFAGELYENIGIVTSAKNPIHVYRCEKELHTLKVHMRNGLPHHIEGIYEVLRERNK